MIVRNILYCFFLLTLNSCNYKITRNYQHSTNTSVPASESNDISIGKGWDLKGINTTYKGTISLNGNAGKCQEQHAMTILRAEAATLGANLVNITLEIQPNVYSMCYQCTADFYELGKNSFSINYKERLVQRYSVDSLLSWNDLKVRIPEDSTFPYKAVFNLQVASGGASFWTGQFKDFTTYSIIYLDISGAKESFSNDSTVRHLNYLFKLSMIYAERLERRLNLGEIKGVSTFIQEALNEQVIDMEKMMKKYQIETNYGRNKENQLVWERWIDEKEL